MFAAKTVQSCPTLVAFTSATGFFADISVVKHRRSKPATSGGVSNRRSSDCCRVSAWIQQRVHCHTLHDVRTTVSIRVANHRRNFWSMMGMVPLILSGVPSHLPYGKLCCYCISIAADSSTV